MCPQLVNHEMFLVIIAFVDLGSGESKCLCALSKRVYSNGTYSPWTSPKIRLRLNKTEEYTLIKRIAQHSGFSSIVLRGFHSTL